MSDRRPITIAFVENGLSLGGGSEQVIYDVIRGFDRKRFRPVLICLHDLGELGEALKKEGITTYEHVVRHRFDPRGVFRLQRLLRKEKADFLYVTDGFHNMVAGRIAAFMARVKQSVIIFHSYDTVLRQTHSASQVAVYSLSDRLLHPTFNQVASLSESHKEYLCQVKGIPPERVSIIYNGIDIERYTPSVDAATARDRFGIPDNAFVVGMVAGLRPWKNHEMLLRSADLVLREHPNALFVIAGDGDERDRLESLASDLGITDRVLFLGRVSNVPDLLAAFDVSALSSIHEAFPLSLLESMAASLPMVATEVGSVHEIVDDGVNGFLIPSGDCQAFADAIMKLANDPAMAKRLGEQGRAKLEERFSAARMVRRCEQLFADWFYGDSGDMPNADKPVGQHASTT